MRPSNRLVSRVAILSCLAALAAACGGGGGDASGASGDPADGGGSVPRDGAGPVDGGGASADAEPAACNAGGCAGGAQCCSGTCVQTASCSFAVLSVTPGVGWQNGGSWVKLTGTGFAPGMRVFFGDGRAPVLVTGPTSAMVQTPPGATGKVDVRVASGSIQATLPQGFSYVSGGLRETWNEIAMHSVRGRLPGLAVMQDGRVLIAGGVTSTNNPATALDTVEVFDRPSTAVSAVTAQMATGRWAFNGAVTLLDRRVLVAGGDPCWFSCSGTSASNKADVFDPAAGSFTAVSMSRPRSFTRAVLLADGRVFVSSYDDGVEIFDPATNTFAQATPLMRHPLGFVVRLRDGRVLMGAGELGAGSADAEIYDPDTGNFTATGSLKLGRFWPNAHTLPDGRVIVFGGATGDHGNWTPTDSIELFDPATGQFTTAPYKLAPGGRHEFGSALVRDGTILAIGGYTAPNACAPTSTVDRIDPVKMTVTPFATMPTANTDQSAVTLLDGSVLVVGGGGCGTSATPNVDFLAGWDN